MQLYARAEALALVARQVERSAPAEQAFQATRHDFATLLRGGPDERHAFVSDYDYDVSGGGHRTVTLAFTNDRSVEGIAAAFF